MAFWAVISSDHLSMWEGSVTFLHFLVASPVVDCNDWSVCVFLAAAAG